MKEQDLKKEPKQRKRCAITSAEKRKALSRYAEYNKRMAKRYGAENNESDNQIEIR